jgi:hypothetical protein
VVPKPFNFDAILPNLDRYGEFCRLFIQNKIKDHYLAFHQRKKSAFSLPPSTDHFQFRLWRREALEIVIDKESKKELERDREDKSYAKGGRGGRKESK